MHAYAFAKKGAEGGAFIMTGESIREALAKLEERSGMRFIMGTPASPKDIENCDKRHIHPTELRALSEAAEAAR